jgi:peptide/nickel transport system substrate-binding protein
MLRRGIQALAWLALVAFSAACSSPVSKSDNAATTRIVYGLTLDVSGIDPHKNSSSELGIPLRQVYDTLVYRDPQTKEFVAGLAESYSVSEDGLAYTFRLRQGVTFHDGTPFNAQAVAANLERITDSALQSEKAVFLLGSYSGYEIVDEYTIRLLLSAPYSPFLDSLSQVYLGIASPTAFTEYSENRYQFHQVGTGPYRFVEYIPGDKIVLQRNPDYAWAPAFYEAGGENQIDEIIFRFFTDPATRSLAIQSGEAQVMGELLPVDARALTGNSTVQLIPTSIPGQPLQFLINTKRFPTDRKAVRQALLYATNRNTIVDTVFQRFSPVAWGPLSASTLYYDRSLNGVYAQDTSQAQNLLAADGFADNNGDGFLDIAGIDLEITVVVPPWGLIPDVAQLIQDQWRAIGIRTVLEPVPTFSSLREKVATGEYNLVAFYSFGLDPVFLNHYFTTDGSNNWTGYSNPQLDDVLRQAAQISDPDVRRSLYAQAQQLIMNEALIVPIRDYVNLNTASSALQGLTFDPYGWFPLLTNAGFNRST